jgi:surface antigen
MPVWFQFLRRVTMRYQQIISIALITTMLAGCNPPPPGAGQDTGGISKQDIGTVLGGVGGAVLGAQFGRGTGQIAAGAAGALLGGFAGSSIGKSLDKADASYANQTAQRALETAPAGQALPWQNPDNGHSGSITPKAPYQMADGTYCREFNQQVVINNQQQTAYGKACRQPDGSWKIIQ